ncbi:MAG: hypothetical protein V3U02_11325 [Calditrichia bacterium]
MIIPELIIEEGLYFREATKEEEQLFKEVAEMGIDISMFESPESYQEKMGEVLEGLWSVINNDKFYIMAAGEHGYAKRDNESMDDFKKRVRLGIISR